jgi:hypothetical protein
VRWRFSVAPGEGPGLLADTWSHVFLDVRGTRPDQMTLLVDGRDFGVRSMGLSRLAGPVSQDSSLIGVESGEGFPTRASCASARSLIEYVKHGPQRARRAAHRERTQRRLRRAASRASPFDLSMTGGKLPGVNTGLSQAVSHAAGTPVALYGYSLPLASNVPSAASALPSALGTVRGRRRAERRRRRDEPRRLDQPRPSRR